MFVSPRAEHLFLRFGQRWVWEWTRNSELREGRGRCISSFWDNAVKWGINERKRKTIWGDGPGYNLGRHEHRAMHWRVSISKSLRQSRAVFWPVLFSESPFVVLRRGQRKSVIPLRDCRTEEFYTMVPRSQNFLLSVELSFDELRFEALQSPFSCDSHISGKVVLHIVVVEASVSMQQNIMHLC